MFFWILGKYMYVEYLILLILKLHEPSGLLCF
jgi:hypothetical protein